MSNFEPPDSQPEPSPSARFRAFWQRLRARLTMPQGLRQAWERFASSGQVQRLTLGRPGLAVGGLTALVVVVVLAVVLSVVLVGGGAEEETAVAPTGTAAAGRTATAPAPTPTLESFNVGLQTPIPGDELTDADLEARELGEPVCGSFTGSRLVIPKIGLDAPFSVKVMGEDGRMAPPDGPEDVAYYDFCAWPGLGGVPGLGGNAIFSGHVDYRDYGPAVLWDLRDLVFGDIIEVHLNDGTVLQYAVQWNKSATPEALNWSNVVVSTAQESITIITCTGVFDSGVRQYDRRLVTWATRIS